MKGQPRANAHWSSSGPSPAGMLSPQQAPESLSNASPQSRCFHRVLWCEAIPTRRCIYIGRHCIVSLHMPCGTPMTQYLAASPYAASISLKQCSLLSFLAL